MRVPVSRPVLATLLLFGFLSPAACQAAGGAAVGAQAPGFSLPAAADGKTVALNDLVGKSKAVAVIFIATGCPYSNAYNDRMVALAKDYAAKGVVVVGINSNSTEPAKDVAAHAKKHGFTFPVVKDAGNKVADLYGARHTPEAYVVDPKGTLVYHGRIDESYESPSGVKSPDLRNALDAVLAGKPVPAAETKAFGCSIKRV